MGQDRVGYPVRVRRRSQRLRFICAPLCQTVTASVVENAHCQSDGGRSVVLSDYCYQHGGGDANSRVHHAIRSGCNLCAVPLERVDRRL